ncbi:hypothetical protein L6452_41891 [Arctium lappa]|uniref:Uncharacterized protein n=1 Tax=Arctium lappa TaxID=4217 RepID=A0ACB8XG74_ARCLA|nr:hypothetical protein L6452_41891 [Arctium lappa]
MGSTILVTATRGLEVLLVKFLGGLDVLLQLDSLEKAKSIDENVMHGEYALMEGGDVPIMGDSNGRSNNNDFVEFKKSLMTREGEESWVEGGNNINLQGENFKVGKEVLDLSESNMQEEEHSQGSPEIACSMMRATNVTKDDVIQEMGQKSCKEDKGPTLDSVGPQNMDIIDRLVKENDFILVALILRGRLIRKTQSVGQKSTACWRAR